MTVAEFKKKWARYQGKESAAYQEHFIDLCRILGHAVGERPAKPQRCDEPSAT
jgi:hypothetical protein